MTPERWLGIFALTATTFLFVVFLIIFVITPVSDLPLFIDFAPSTTAEKAPDLGSDIHVTIRENGTTFVGAEAVTIAELPLALREHRRRDTSLLLRIHRTTPFRYVRRVVAAARAAGFARVTILTRRIPDVRFTAPAPAVVRQPQCPADFIFTEKLSWLDHDITSRFRVTIDAHGHVTHTELIAMQPIDIDLAAGLERYQSQCLHRTRFAPPPSAPCTYEITLHLYCRQKA